MEARLGECFGGPEIDGEFKGCRQFYWKLSGSLDREGRIIHFARTIGPDVKTPSRGPKSLTLVAFCARLALDDD
jgi:hypothetical protein